MKSGETKAFSQVKKSTVTELKQKVRDIKTASPCFAPWMIRKDGLYLQGNRGQLLAALQNYQHRFTCLIRLQTAWRTYLARSFYKFKQPRKICANETDFCTMDPIDEIPTGQLICVQHSPDSPHYGFNIISLLNYFYKSRATLLSNPFNRDPIPLSTIFKWICLARILDPTVYSQIQSEPFYKYFLAKKKGRTTTTLTAVAPVPVPTPTTGTNPIQYNRLIVFEEEHIALNHHLQQIQHLPINMRVQELFIDFDLCGNYTNADWFLQLNLRFLKNFYLRLKELWRNLPPIIQQSICTVGDPFYLVQCNHMNVSFQEFKLACVCIMEFITYGTHNREDQKLGVFQILIALASVSYSAHNSLTHLINM